MDSDNPYQAPQAQPPERHHATAILKEAWRGAKFGAKVMLCICGLAISGLTLFMATVTLYRWHAHGRTPREQFGNSSVLEMIGSAIAGTLLLTLYAGIAGAVVMGLAALGRRIRTGKQPKC